MKKQILKMGAELSKAEQKSIQGGSFRLNECVTDNDCCHFQHTQSYGYLCYDYGTPGQGGYCAPAIFEFNPCP